ncbi:TetR/AcrR family transcriptional regulator [Phreatobacter stygius]|uniref:TetR/AcrR family transcriptional regulator n=1 Tax=Phreatobacter stygius TaxID=1940610 RepID=A0A4D7BAD4_9HYPH|nr:TetR/AcrR family transcriptional regulator [Phreatobacter stygius]QCI65037.1 TetR/AcrR family transcriptional regulator [Phreatobacter stygius]
MQDEAGSPFRDREQRLEDRERKRETVLRAAVRMFNARGFHAASLDEVAASIGVSKPTIYHYLGNKEQVLLECFTRGLDALDRAVEKASAAPGTGLERLSAFLVRYAENNMSDFGRCVVRTGNDALSPEGAARFRAMKRKIDGHLRRLVAEAMADGSAAPADVKLTAFTLASAVNGSAFWFSADGALPARAVAEAIVAILTAGLAPRAVPQPLG